MQQAVYKPLKTHGDFHHLPAKAVRHPVNDGTADQGFADGQVLFPQGAVLRKVGNRHAEVMVGVHQPHAFGDNTVAVKVGIVAEGNIKILF